MNIKNFFIIVTLLTVMSCASKPSIHYDKKKNYLEDSKMYYNYKEFEKAIENAWVVILYNEDRKKIEDELRSMEGEEYVV